MTVIRDFIIITDMTKLVGRDIHEQNRVSTPLELFFDLTFVVAIAISSAEMHREISAGLGLQVLPSFALTFFGSWWAWMNYTWFASAYAEEDFLFRILTLVQMLGVLIFAAGLINFFHSTVSVMSVVGYAVMRFALALQWLRAAYDDPKHRKVCLRYAIGILIAQTLWIVRIWFPSHWLIPSFVLFALFELAVPVYAELIDGSGTGTPWHPHHIAERYSLFTIICIGEGILGAANSIVNVIKSTGLSLDFALTAIGSISLVFGLWWLYFMLPSGEALHQQRKRAFTWGYSHFFVFLALAAIGSALSVAADTFLPETKATAYDAIKLLGLWLAVYIAMVCGLYSYITKVGCRNLLLVVSSLLLIIGIVYLAKTGTPLSWSMLLLNLPTLLVIYFFECSKAHKKRA